MPSTRQGIQASPTASPAADVLALAADPAAPGAFFAGTKDGLFRSLDGGESWVPSGAGLPPGTAVVQLLRDSRSGAWYASTERRGVFRSTDGGHSWSLIEGPPDLAAPQLVLDPKVPDRLYAAVHGQGLWTWRPGRGTP